ncbi:syntaxin-16 [Caerostris darwini]|uniref:Syntaxin-16 n=1 Tax=Caerostris darwini TaxID=1538125 RepID=A0AAV4THE3_9ARAC|nr:syntaxin-16 [Caerostris darwini]
MAATINVTSRNLTDVFVLMRNNSLQNRNIFSDQAKKIPEILDDKVALVSSRELDNGHSFSRCIDLPPVWVEGIEDVQYEMNRIRNKLKELKALHEKNVTRPSFDDSVHEEKEIENISQEITRMFHHCQKIIHQIRERSRGTTSQDYQVSQNVVSSLVTSLQELSAKFHSAQSEHLRQLRSRRRNLNNSLIQLMYQETMIVQCSIHCKMMALLRVSLVLEISNCWWKITLQWLNKGKEKLSR